VFGDRLINEEDRVIVEEKLIGSIVKANFDDSYEYVMKNPLLFGDFLTSNPTTRIAVISKKLRKNSIGFYKSIIMTRTICK
jgi:dynein heavy chain